MDGKEDRLPLRNSEAGNAPSGGATKNVQRREPSLAPSLPESRPLERPSQSSGSGQESQLPLEAPLVGSIPVPSRGGSPGLPVATAHNADTGTDDESSNKMPVRYTPDIEKELYEVVLRLNPFKACYGSVADAWNDVATEMGKYLPNLKGASAQRKIKDDLAKHRADLVTRRTRPDGENPRPTEKDLLLTRLEALQMLSRPEPQKKQKKRKFRPGSERGEGFGQDPALALSLDASLPVRPDNIWVAAAHRIAQTQAESQGDLASGSSSSPARGLLALSDASRSVRTQSLQDLVYPSRDPSRGSVRMDSTPNGTPQGKDVAVKGVRATPPSSRRLSSASTGAGELPTTAPQAAQASPLPIFPGAAAGGSLHALTGDALSHTRGLESLARLGPELLSAALPPGPSPRDVDFTEDSDEEAVASSPQKRRRRGEAAQGHRFQKGRAVPGMGWERERHAMDEDDRRMLYTEAQSDRRAAAVGEALVVSLENIARSVQALKGTRGSLGQSVGQSAGETDKAAGSSDLADDISKKVDKMHEELRAELHERLDDMQRDINYKLSLILEKLA
eukprot:Rmarinus@m.1330